MNTSTKIDRLYKKLAAEKSKRLSAESKLRNSKIEIDKLNSAIKNTSKIDITSTIFAIHQLRKTNRKLDIYHVAVLSYASEVGKFTASQFMRRMNSGKNKFYEVMIDMREWGYIDTTETSYRVKRVWFHLTTKGAIVAERLKESTKLSLAKKGREMKLDGKKK